MNNRPKLTVCFALLLLATPLAVRATAFFADYFTNSSTLNQAPTAPTINSASYQTYIGTTNAGSVPGLSAGQLTIAFPNTSSVLGEGLVRFASTPVALSETGDYLEAMVVFVNTSNILSAAAGVTLNANSSVNIGLFNSGGVNPNQGQFAINHGAAMSLLTGGTEDWVGYIGRIGYSGNNAIITRPTQTPATTSNSRNQDLMFNNASSTQSFGEPTGSSANGPAGSSSLVQGSTNTLYLKVTLTATGTTSVSNALFNGVGLGGTMVYSQERTNLTGANFTAGFDGLAIGWRNNSSPGQGSAMTLLAVEISGQTTVVTSPPDIVTQPVPVTVPNGGSCAYWVVAQGFNMTYQWHRYGTNLVNGGNISGATSDTLIISPASAADAASGANGYYVTITGTGGYSTNSVTNSLTLGAAKNLIWSGSGNIWDLGTSANWLSGGNPATFNFGDAVTFDDTAAGGLRLVTLTGKYLSASSVTVDGSQVYAFQAASTGGFAGPGNLIYKSSNQLTIGNVNTYSGGTLISNTSAYLLLQNYNGLGTGPVTLAKAGGQMEIVPSSDTSLVGINGDIIVADDFRIQVNGTGSFATLFKGNLSGTAGKVLTLDPKDLSTTNRFRVYGANTAMHADIVLNGPATAEANYYGTTLAPYNATGSQLYDGVISGNGGIIQRSSGTTILAGQNTYAGGTTPTTGTIAFGADSTPTTGTVTSGPIGTGPLYLAPEVPNATGNGAVQAFGGARTIANPLQHPSATNNQTLVISGTNDLTFTGAYTLNGTDGAGTFTNRIWQVDNTGLTTLAGVLSDNGQNFGLVKTGNGTLALDANNTYTGRTAISNGTLRVNGQIAGDVLVATNATLAGAGTVSGPVTVLMGGRISPGSSIGTLTLNNNLSFYHGGLAIEVNKSAGTTSDRINVSGTLTNTGAGLVTITNLGPALAPGDSFTLFDKAVTGGNTMTITGGAAIWTNKLAVDGTIAVVSVVAATPTNLNYSVSGANLTLSWPPNYLTWLLQSNIVGVASSGNWFVVPNSGSTTQVVVTVNPARSNVFYRLVAP